MWGSLGLAPIIYKIQLTAQSLSQVRRGGAFLDFVHYKLTFDCHHEDERAIAVTKRLEGITHTWWEKERKRETERETDREVINNLHGLLALITVVNTLKGTIYVSQTNRFCCW